MTETARNRSPSGVGAAALVLAAILAYLPALRSGFVWDDDAHVTRPELQSLAGLGRIWFQPGATQQYYPVLHSAFWVEHRLWGDAPLGYHLVNVLLHATSAWLLVILLTQVERVVPDALGGPQSRTNALRSTRSTSRSSASGTTRSTWFWFAGFLFALHPVCVESVAWVSEQKNTLSTVFYLLAGLAYLKFAARAEGVESLKASATAVGDAHDRSGNVQVFDARLYALATLFFILALLSKSVTATLPAALLVVLWWKRGRLSWRRDVAPLLPWFALALAAGLITAWVERTYVGARGAAFSLTVLQRIALAGRIAWFYFGKLIWPGDLVFIYPRWSVALRLWSWVPAAGVIVILAAAWLRRRRARGPLAAMLLFLGALFPALGFFNVYPFIFSYVADHFQYLACLAGCGTAGVWLSRWRSPAEPAGPPCLAWPVLCLLAFLTFRQCRVYRDAETLYTATLARNPGCWLAELNLGNLRLAAGRVDEAVARYRRAETLEPDYPSTHFNLGRVLLQSGQPGAAAVEFGAAARLNPADFQARENLGIALAQSGRLTEAEAQIRAAIRLRPNDARAHLNLGSVLFQAGRAGEAAAEYRDVLAVAPASAEAARARENLARLDGGQRQSGP